MSSPPTGVKVYGRIDGIENNILERFLATYRVYNEKRRLHKNSDDADLDQILQALTVKASDIPRQPSIHVAMDDLAYFYIAIGKYVAFLEEAGVFNSVATRAIDGNEAIFSVDSALIKARHSKVFLQEAFKKSFEISLISYVMVESLLILKESMDLDYYAQCGFITYLNPSKLVKFGLWNMRNSLPDKSVNNVVPNAIVDAATLPFKVHSFNLLNKVYVYNSIVHFICQNPASSKLNLIWQDPLSKLRLNELIYLQVFLKIDPSFGFTPGDVTRSSMDHFRSTAASVDLNSVFESYLDLQSFENFANTHLNYHKVTCAQDLIEIFCFFYDMPVAQYLEGAFSGELFSAVLQFLGLQFVPSSVVDQYETDFSLAYLKFLRFKTFLVSDVGLQNVVLHLESVLDTLKGLSTFFGKSSHYSQECITSLMNAGIDSKTAGITENLSFFNYIGLID